MVSHQSIFWSWQECGLKPRWVQGSAKGIFSVRLMTHTPGKTQSTDAVAGLIRGPAGEHCGCHMTACDITSCNYRQDLPQTVTLWQAGLLKGYQELAGPPCVFLEDCPYYVLRESQDLGRS
jgi:hypothetical protein